MGPSVGVNGPQSTLFFISSPLQFHNPQAYSDYELEFLMIQSNVFIGEMDMWGVGQRDGAELCHGRAGVVGIDLDGPNFVLNLIAELEVSE